MNFHYLNIIVTGPYGAGKTEFVRAISEIDVVSTDITTVETDYGSITIDTDLVVYFFGTPGQQRFDFMWEIYSVGMRSFIVIVDSTRPETFLETKSILEAFRSYAPVPYVVAANKQDQPGAISHDQLYDLLELPHYDTTQVLPCIATDRECVKGVALQAIYNVLDMMDESILDMMDESSVQSSETMQPQQIHTPRRAMPMIPVSPVKLESHDLTHLQVIRATPLEDSDRIAAFLNALESSQTNARTIYLSFGKHAYFLATVDEQIVGIGTFYIENLIMRIMALHVSPVVDNQIVGRCLLKSIEEAAHVAMAEIAITASYMGQETVFQSHGYEIIESKQLSVPDWREAAAEVGKNIMVKRLLEYRVMKPIQE